MKVVETEERVRLIATETTPEEFGHIESGPHNGTYVVRLEERESREDDGIREVPVEQIEKIE
jgi:hypothetical protein